MHALQEMAAACRQGRGTKEQHLQMASWNLDRIDQRGSNLDGLHRRATHSSWLCLVYTPACCMSLTKLQEPHCL